MEIEYCKCCGKIINQRYKNKFGLCKKHLHQYEKYGKCLDNNSRTVFDPNEVRIKGDVSEIDTYDAYGNVMHTYLIDTDDIPLLAGHKWRSIIKRDKNKPYLGTEHTIYFHLLILGYPNGSVDHININTLDNRKENLRVVSNTIQQYNQNLRVDNTSGIKGIYFDKLYNKYHAEFSWHNQRFISQRYSTIEEAIYCRYLFEQVFAAEYSNITKKQIQAIRKLSDQQKEYIQNWIIKYFERKGREDLGNIVSGTTKGRWDDINNRVKHA